jgi:periplasmic copper chaperone A
MKRFLILILMSVLLLYACKAAPHDDHEDVPGTDVEAHDPWARAALKDGESAVYMLLHNHSAEDDALVAVTTDVAASVELQLTAVDANDVVKMTPQESIPLPSGIEMELKPGSYHIMLIGVTKDLKVGDEIQVTLHFLHHEDIPLTVPVLEAAATNDPAMEDMP